MEEWTWVSLEQVTFRHTLQKNTDPLKVLQEALRAECFLSVKDTLMLDLAFQAVSTTTRTNSESHLPNISAIYSQGRQGCQILMHSPKISAVNPGCKRDQLATYLLIMSSKKKHTKKIKIFFFKRGHSIILFSNSIYYKYFTQNQILQDIFDCKQGRVENIFPHKTHNCTYIVCVYIYMQYTHAYMYFLEYILSM